MDIVQSRDVLEGHGLADPELNVLVPSQDNYTSILFQPKGNLEVGQRQYLRDSVLDGFDLMLRFLDSWITSEP